MKVLVLAAMTAAYFLCAAALAPLGRRLDEKKRRFLSVFPPEKEFMSEELHAPFRQRFLQPAAKKILSAFAFFNVFRRGDRKRLEKLARELKMAGIGLSPQEFTVAKTLLQLVIAALAAVFTLRVKSAPLRLFIPAFGILVALLLPSFLLRKRISVRQEAIRDELPAVMDLLVVSMEAGLGLDASILRLYEKRKTPLMQELVRPVRDVQMGLDRRSALKELGERNDVNELKIFAGSLVQAEQLGVSIKSVLVSQAEQLRTARKQRVEAKAMKAPVKMMIPTVIFIFPVMFIILLAPAVMRFAEAF
ncbi:MAG TPA: type II secretion system F family protein [Oscillospiraceae bacterium]|nr:type II secretion system F family protein [Oscillospiraceae bacterium]